MDWKDFFKETPSTKASLVNSEDVRSFFALESSSPHRTVMDAVKDYDTLGFNLFEEVLHLTPEEVTKQENLNLLTLFTLLTEISDIIIADRRWNQTVLFQFSYGEYDPKASDISKALYGNSTDTELVGVVLDPLGKDNKNERDVVDVGINKPILEKLSFLLTQKMEDRDIALMVLLTEVVYLAHKSYEQMIDSVFTGYGKLFDYAVFMDGKTQEEKQVFLLDRMLTRATEYIEFSMGGPTTEIQLLSLSTQIRQMVAYEWKRHPETTIIAEVLNGTKDPAKLGYVIDYVIGDKYDPEARELYFDTLKKDTSLYTSGQSLGQPESMIDNLISVYGAPVKDKLVNTWLLGNTYYSSEATRPEIKYVALRTV